MRNGRPARSPKEVPQQRGKSTQATQHAPNEPTQHANRTHGNTEVSDSPKERSQGQGAHREDGGARQGDGLDDRSQETVDRREDRSERCRDRREDWSQRSSERAK
jgi:hypothetical protein